MKNSEPKRRWKLLSSAILNKNTSANRLLEFPDYGLIKFEDLYEENDVSVYSVQPLECPQISLKLGVLHKKLTLDDIAGFNNTGNVRLWPSESVLTQYLLENPWYYEGKSVLELGGGMTCLGALLTAASLKPKSVHCTDGHPTSVENIQRNIERNKDVFSSHVNVTSGLLRWDAQERVKKTTYDLIICSDCLFFKAGRKELAEFILNGLNSGGGRALIFAPKRHGTLNDFFQCLRRLHSSAEVKLISDYSKKVSIFRSDTLEQSPLYDEELHYPYLIDVRKN